MCCGVSAGCGDVRDVTVVETGVDVSTPLLVTTAPSDEDDLDSTGERLGRRAPSPAMWQVSLSRLYM